MIVEILLNGKIVAEKVVHFGALNYEPSDQEWFTLALDDAIDDGEISQDERNKVVCRFKE